MAISFQSDEELLRNLRDKRARCRMKSKRLDSAVLTADRIDQAAWSEGVAASAATFQGSSSSMRLIG